MPLETEHVTELLGMVSSDPAASGRLWGVIYDELHALAMAQMAGEGPGRTLQPTALVHEAYVRLTGDKDYVFANRRHFFAAAAEAMRRIRVEEARRRKRVKRGRGWKRKELEPDTPGKNADDGEVLAVHDALEKLEKLDPRKALVVRLRYFVGMTEEETAAAMEVSRRTVQNDWAFARAWLHRELGGGSGAEASDNRDGS